MKSIYKYKLQDIRESAIHMPIGAQILSVQSQNDDVVIWALIDTFYTNTERKFIKFITGENIPSVNNMIYIGTVLRFNDKFVEHIYEKYEQ